MPVRSLNSSVFKWPNRKTVDDAVRTWAASVLESRPEALRLGYFGSYARGDWGVGSDLDLVAIVVDSTKSFERRALIWDLNSLPFPAELLVYTLAEWNAMIKEGTRFARALERETTWVLDRSQRDENDADS